MGADVRFGPARWGTLAVALINTAPSERQEDLLTAAGQLRALLLAHDEPGPVDVDDRDLADARQARDALGAVFRARDSEQHAAALLNDLLARTAQPRLVEHEGVPLHLHVDAPGASWGGWLAASGAMALALLIAEHGTDVLGRCQAPGCAHVLLRTGPGPARRFCDNACASRTRVAAYRARQAGGAVHEARNDGSARGAHQNEP
jgi:predicted RNA-binding Zn ribbon-like protein